MTTTPVLTRQMAKWLAERLDPTKLVIEPRRSGKTHRRETVVEALRAIADGRARVQVQCDHVGPNSGRQYTREDCAVCHGTGWKLAP